MEKGWKLGKVWRANDRYRNMEFCHWVREDKGCKILGRTSQFTVVKTRCTIGHTAALLEGRNRYIGGRPILEDG
jgi:hypothetical protein